MTGGPAAEEDDALDVDVGGRRVRISNPGKVLWPATGTTKLAMVDYYLGVAAWLLPHIRGRPLTLARFPDGVDGMGWYQSNCRGHPDWMPVHEIRGRRGAVLRLCVVNDAASLVWTANLGNLEIHPFLAYAERPDEPTVVAFDLDPGPPAGLRECCRVALRLRDQLAALGLEACPKTSGGAGLHVYVPLNGRVSFQETKGLARSIAEGLERERPERVVARQRRDLRSGRVLIDWLQNDPTRSTVAPYSLRATREPFVSTPLAWEEVETAARARDGAEADEMLRFRPDQVVERLAARGELFAPVLALAQVLPSGVVPGPTMER